MWILILVRHVNCIVINDISDEEDVLVLPSVYNEQ